MTEREKKNRAVIMAFITDAAERLRKTVNPKTERVRVELAFKNCKDCDRGDCRRCAEKKELERLVTCRSCMVCNKENHCTIAPKYGETIRINCPEFEPMAMEATT